MLGLGALRVGDEQLGLIATVAFCYIIKYLLNDYTAPVLPSSASMSQLLSCDIDLVQT